MPRSGNLVYDALRQRASLTHAMEAASRALVIAVLRWRWGMTIDAISEIWINPHGPGPVSDEERARLENLCNGEAPPWVKGDYPEWLDSIPLSHAPLGKDAASRAPPWHFAPQSIFASTRSKFRLRKCCSSLKNFMRRRAVSRPPAFAWPCRPPPAATLMSKRSPPMAGAGSKCRMKARRSPRYSPVQGQASNAPISARVLAARLALAALMENKGQIYAYDADRHRLRPIFERMLRAGARNIQVIPSDAPERLAELEGKMDMVLIDAPCLGSGARAASPMPNGG